MRIFLVMAVLVPAAASAQATWVEVGTTAGGDALWVDSSSIRSTEGSKRRAWIKMQFGMSDEGFKSARLLKEVDCSEERIRDLQITFYEGANLDGRNANAPTPGEDWLYAAPGTVAGGLLKSICEPPLDG